MGSCTTVCHGAAFFFAALAALPAIFRRIAACGRGDPRIFTLCLHGILTLFCVCNDSDVFEMANGAFKRGAGELKLKELDVECGGLLIEVPTEPD